MELKVLKRSTGKKSASLRLRLEGQIPAVIYGLPGKSAPISVDSTEIQQYLRKLEPGQLATSRFTLVDEQGEKTPVLIKEIQYHPTSYEILHLDFSKLEKGKKVNVNIPVEFVGVADCVGVKQGGSIRQVIRKIPVRCTPETMPTSFTLNVAPMAMGDLLRIRDLEIPAGVEPKIGSKEVIVVIAKR